nr:hypothetical protein [Polyangiaceae bacterium]
MDPLVRAAFGLQQLLSRFSGTVISVASAVYLVFWTAQAQSPWHGWLALAVVLVSLVFRVV